MSALVTELARVIRRRSLVEVIRHNMACDQRDVEPVDVRAALKARQLGWELDWADEHLAGRAGAVPSTHE